MSPYVNRVVARLRDAELALSRDARQQRRRWRYRIQRGRVRFDQEVRLFHRQCRQSIPAFLRQSGWLNLLTTPVIYSLGLPLLILDIWVSAYQWICFPIYGIARVPRRRYFVIDRHKLGYLNAIEHVNCLYCSYATGLFAYVREIAARTEQYWCPIKHSRPIAAPHSHYQLFLDYGDAASYRQDLPALRRVLREQPTGRSPHSTTRRHPLHAHPPPGDARRR